MLKGTKVRKLAGAAGHLCLAYDDLAAAGYQQWRDELLQLIEIISAEIGCLEADAITRKRRAS